jgi:hypothetical protein
VWWESFLGSRFADLWIPMSVGRDRTEVVSCRGPQISKPILAGAAVGKARSGNQYPAIAIDPKLMAATAMPIELIASIEEGAFHFGVFHVSSKGLFVNSFVCGLWKSNILL